MKWPHLTCLWFSVCYIRQLNRTCSAPIIPSASAFQFKKKGHLLQSIIVKESLIMVANEGQDGKQMQMKLE